MIERMRVLRNIQYFVFVVTRVRVIVTRRVKGYMVFGKVYNR